MMAGFDAFRAIKYDWRENYAFHDYRGCAVVYAEQRRRMKTLRTVPEFKPIANLRVVRACRRAAKRRHVGGG